MSVFKFKVLYGLQADDLENELNRLGKQGYEVVAYGSDKFILQKCCDEGDCTKEFQEDKGSRDVRTTTNSEEAELSSEVDDSEAVGFEEMMFMGSSRSTRKPNMMKMPDGADPNKVFAVNGPDGSSEVKEDEMRKAVANAIWRKIQKHQTNCEFVETVVNAAIRSRNRTEIDNYASVIVSTVNNIADEGLRQNTQMELVEFGRGLLLACASQKGNLSYAYNRAELARYEDALNQCNILRCRDAQQMTDFILLTIQVIRRVVDILSGREISGF